VAGAIPREVLSRPPSLSWVKMFASVKRSSLFRDDGKKGFQFMVSLNEAREAKNWQDG